MLHLLLLCYVWGGTDLSLESRTRHVAPAWPKSILFHLVGQKWACDQSWAFLWPIRRLAETLGEPEV